MLIVILLISFHRGKWKGTKSCARGLAICGIRVRIEEKRGNGWNQGVNDDTALNGAEFQCCSLPEIRENHLQTCFSNKPTNDRRNRKHADPMRLRRDRFC